MAAVVALGVVIVVVGTVIILPIAGGVYGYRRIKKHRKAKRERNECREYTQKRRDDMNNNRIRGKM